MKKTIMRMLIILVFGMLVIASEIEKIEQKTIEIKFTEKDKNNRWELFG